MSRDLLLVCFLCVLVRLPWVFTIPASEAPDEHTHLWVISFLRDNLRLPAGGEVAAAGPNAVYGSLPQLGYLPHVIVTRLFPDNSVSLFARFGSLLMGLVTVWAGFRIGHELFCRSRLLSLALPLLLVFHPQLVFVHSYANNDATASAVASVIVHFLIRLLKYGLTLRRSLVIGLLICWLSLCKYSGWTLFPVVALALASAAVIHGAGAAVTVLSFFLIGVIVLLGTGGWLLRNYHEFSADWLGTKTMYHTWAVAFHKKLAYHIAPGQVIADKRWWRFLLFSFWGMFGYTNRYIWRPLYYVFLGFHIGSLAGWVKSFTGEVKSFTGEVKSVTGEVKSVTGEVKTDTGEEQSLTGAVLFLTDRRWSKNELVGPAVWTMLGLCCLFNLAGMVYASTENLGGPQGRYLFVSEIPVMAIMLSGLARLGPKAGRYAVIALIVFTALVSIGSWIMLFRLYGFHAHP